LETSERWIETDIPMKEILQESDSDLASTCIQRL
jgi:hypothetical protein